MGIMSKALKVVQKQVDDVSKTSSLIHTTVLVMGLQKLQDTIQKEKLSDIVGLTKKYKFI